MEKKLNILTVNKNAIPATTITITLPTIPTPALCAAAAIVTTAIIARITTIRTRINSRRPNHANYKK